MSSIVGTSRGAIEGQPSADGLDCSDVQASSARTPQLEPRPQRVAAPQPRSGEKRGRGQCINENEGEGRDKEEAAPVAKRPRLAEEKENSARRRSDGPPPPDLADGDEGGDAGPDAGVSSSEEGVQLDGAAVVHAGPGQRGESIGEEASPKRRGNGRRGTRSAEAEQRRTEEKRKNRKSSKRRKQKKQKSAAASPSSPPATVPEGSGRESWATEKFHAPPGWRGKRFNPTEQRLHRGQLQFRKEVEHITDKDGNPIPWNCLRLSWKVDPKSNKVIVLVLHYQTLEAARSLDDKHTAAALRSDGTLRECAWESTRQGVGPELYGDMIQCDVYPFPFKAYTSPYSYLSRKDVAFVMESWKRNVLSVLHEDDNVQIALCSKATGTLWAHHLLGGDDADLATFHAQNPGKLVSASVDELKLPCHPSSMYKKLFQSCMKTKCGDTDDFYSAVQVAETGDASAKCSYFMGFFNKKSDFFRLCDLAHREGCRRGGETTGKMASEAAQLYREKRFGEMTDMHWYLLESRSRGGTERQENERIVEETVAFFINNKSNAPDISSLSEPELGQVMLMRGGCPEEKMLNIKLQQRIRERLVLEIEARKRNEEACAAAVPGMQMPVLHWKAAEAAAEAAAIENEKKLQKFLQLEKEWREDEEEKRELMAAELKREREQDTALQRRIAEAKARLEQQKRSKEEAAKERRAKAKEAK